MARNLTPDSKSGQRENLSYQGINEEVVIFPIAFKGHKLSYDDLKS